jgi:cytoskeleton-associated protein 5
MSTIVSKPANVVTSDPAPPPYVAPPVQKPVDMSLAYAVPPGSAPLDPIEIKVTLENLEESLKSTNWQYRKESYIFLTERMQSMVSNCDAMNQLNADTVFTSLDSFVCKALNEKTAGAHDAALSLAIMFTDSCKESCTEECLRSITSALLKGTAFASSRKTTMTLAEDLVLKMIEVSPENSSSIQTTCDLIQQHGLKSKKPKVVLFSAKLILRAVQEFGVTALPVPALSSISELLISNSNNEVRETGINIMAEVCRALGSKSILQSQIDKMKPALQSQLDELLTSKPTPSIPIRSLRCQKSQSAGDATPAMKQLSEADVKAQMFASRAAVNLFEVLPKTSYKEKIKLEKWSEKCAALDDLIKAGGEQPFKLVPPSATVNYVTIIRELSKLLGHTHCAVVSKSLESLGMLAEGVGEDLYPQLRPLISTLAGLFKDKKVCKAVASCLDKMYGNVFSFGHLLDSKDSLPSSLDEKVQKNALARASVLDYLGRCVSVKQSHGNRGQLTPEYAEQLCKLGCSKLQDSDAATRKAATNLLVLLLKFDDDAISSIAKDSTASLQTSNPRVFKSLQQAVAGPVSFSATSNSSRPATAPSRPPSTKNENVRPTTAVPKTVNKSSAPMSSDNNADDSAKLISFEDAVDKLALLGIPKWSDDIDEGGIFAGIQCKLVVSHSS